MHMYCHFVAGPVHRLALRVGPTFVAGPVYRLALPLWLVPSVASAIVRVTYGLMLRAEKRSKMSELLQYVAKFRK